MIALYRRSLEINAPFRHSNHRCSNQTAVKSLLQLAGLAVPLCNRMPGYATGYPVAQRGDGCASVWNTYTLKHLTATVLANRSILARLFKCACIQLRNLGWAYQNSKAVGRLPWSMHMITHWINSTSITKLKK